LLNRPEISFYLAVSFSLSFPAELASARVFASLLEPSGASRSSEVGGNSLFMLRAGDAAAGGIAGRGGIGLQLTMEDKFSPMCSSMLVGREINSVALSLDSRRLVCGIQDHTVQHWDVEKKCCLAVLKGHKYWVNCVAYSPDSIRVASASADKTVKVWNVHDNLCETTLHGHLLAIASVAFSDDATRLVSGSWDKTVRVWDVELGQCMLTLGGHTDWVHSVAWMPGGHHLASASSDHSVRVWDVIAGAVEQVLVGHLQTVTSIHYARDGVHLASGSLDRTVRVWNVREGCLAARLQHDGDEDSVHCVYFAPDSERIVVGCKDKSVRVWNFRTGEQEGRFSGHEDPVLGVCISPEGSRIFSCGHDKTVRIWRMPARLSQVLPAPPCAPAGAAQVGAHQAALAHAAAAARAQATSQVSSAEVSSLGYPAPVVATYTVASSFKDLQERLRTTEETNQRLRRTLAEAQAELEEKNLLLKGREFSLNDQERQLTNYRDMVNSLAVEKEKLERSFEQMRREMLQMPAAPAGISGSAASGSQVSGSVFPSNLPLGPAGGLVSGAASFGQAGVLRVNQPAGGTDDLAQASYGSNGGSNTPPQRLPARIAAGLRREQGAGGNANRRTLPRNGLASSSVGFSGIAGGTSGSHAPSSPVPEGRSMVQVAPNFAGVQAPGTGPGQPFGGSFAYGVPSGGLPPQRPGQPDNRIF